MKYCLRSVASLPLLLVISLLTACGFHLRGQMDINSELAALAVTGDDVGFVRQFTRALSSTGIQVTDSAPYRINILKVNEQVEDRTHATAGHYEKLLQLKVIYQLETQNNLSLFEPITLTAERYVSENEDFVNAAASEDKVVYQELRENLMFRLVSRIASISGDKLRQEVERAKKVADYEKQQVQQGNDA